MVQKNGKNDKVSTLANLDFRPVMSKHVSRAISKRSVLSVVNHKNGTRIAVDGQVIEVIGASERIQVALNDKGIAIGEGFADEYNYFPLKKAANKAIIYSSPLVKEITEAFNLDFSNVSSISFHDVEYLKVGSHTVAFIKMIRNLGSNEDDELDLDSDSEDDSDEDDELDLDSDSEDDNDEDDELDLDSDSEDDSDEDDEFDPDSNSEDNSDEDDELDLDSDSEDDSDEDKPQNLPLSSQRRRKRSA
ncbi:hypothetical protein KQI74_12905 [Paenibacillus barcinonensis]|uniref:hypothetical protein n=1 Tax=Paenibacillus barcinonensis TaxID=198119 RepID=UPI001C128DD2|nr:hypothetical protein [Paenibacillus barcinonensis]MBU5353191.1 hypothetical protein [Paenibacillus barcinonensis]